MEFGTVTVKFVLPAFQVRNSLSQVFLLVFISILHLAFKHSDLQVEVVEFPVDLIAFVHELFQVLFEGSFVLAKVSHFGFEPLLNLLCGLQLFLSSVEIPSFALK